MDSASEALSEFVSEAQEIVDGLGRDLLKLGERRDGEPDPDLINRVFRAAHSLKGLAAMFGITHLAQLAHAAEDLLDEVRMGRVSLSDDLVDLLLEIAEAFQRIIAWVGRGDGSQLEGSTAALASGLIERIRLRCVPEPAASAPHLEESLGLDASVRNVLTEHEEHRLRENLRKGMRLLCVRTVLELAKLDTALPALNERLKRHGEVISTLPSAEPAGDASSIGFDLVFGTSAGDEEIRAAITDFPAKLCPFGNALADGLPLSGAHGVAPREVSARAWGGSTDRPGIRDQRTPAAEKETSLRSVSQSVRVDIKKLDRLMNVIGDLVLVKTNLQRLTESFRSGNVHDSREAGTEMQRETKALGRKLDELQKGILEVRMVPLEQVFDKLARMVRKIARDAGKEIDLLVSGGDVELDKLIVEDLSDPLMHTIRNAVDHGIELPAERAKAGKPSRGTVTLAARQRGNHVVIEVSDDGAGIDEEAVRQAAIERGLTTAQAAKDLTRRDVLSFLFLPGFSTAKKVSELSGRGVGLDVVKTNISNLSGIIDVQSTPGQGTTLSLTLPVTLAIIRALVVGAAGRAYAVPLTSVLEILSVSRKAVRAIDTREMIDVRGATIPLVRLSRLFRLSGPESADSLFVVVVGLAQDRLGIAVDDLIGQQDVVVKPLGKLLANIRGIAGATDLGNRRTVLVLDVGAIIDEVLAGERAVMEVSA
jgi:two-component system chemotaxis sensor kinase CheA